MAITEDILVRLRVQGQQQFATAMGGAATQTGRLGTAAGTTGKRVDDTGNKAKRAAGKMAAFGRGVGGMAVGFGALAAGQKIVTDSVTNAVNLGEQINKTAVVFRGPGAKAVQNWSKTTATGIGISRRAALEAAGTFGNMLVPMGLGRQEAGKMSTQMVNLAGDMASFNNATPEETLEALRAGIAGETEPLRRFGVRLSQARIEQQAMSMGLKKGKAPLTDHARALATQALILKDTKDAQGDFGRTSDSLANQQRIMAAKWEEFTAAIGGKLVPILSFLAKHLDVIGPILFVIAAALTAVGIAAAIAWAATLSPVLLIVAGIAAVAAALVIAYNKSKTFRNIVNALFGAWKKVMGVLLGGVKAAFKWLIGAIPKVWNIIKNTPLIWLIRNFGKIKGAATAAFNWVKKAAGNAANWVKTAWNNVIGFFKKLPGRIAGAASGMWDGIKNAFRSAINTVIGWWNGLEFYFNLPNFLPGVPDAVRIETPNIGTLAEGGPALAGRPYLVGEQGPELFVPGASGTVLPNGAGGPIHTHVYLNGLEIATAVGNAAADRKARR